MLYALIGSALLGALSTAFLLWRKSVAETALADCEGRLKIAQGTIEALVGQNAAYKDQLARQTDQIQTLRIQRDQAIDALTKSGIPGSLADLLRGSANAAVAKKP